MSLKRTTLVLLAGLLLVAGTALAGGKPYGSLTPGFDYWQTLGSGATGYAFDTEPLPKGFFCAASEAFAGVVYFSGLPLRTEPADILGTTDTVIERMDEAVFNKQGFATTRIRARALNLAAENLIKTSCGAWKVTATLADRQPVTNLVFHRTNPLGGTFKADLRLRVQMTFSNVASGQTRTVVRTVNMPTIKASDFAIVAQPSDPTPIATRCIQTAVVEAAKSVRLFDGAATSVEQPDHTTKLTAADNVLNFSDRTATTAQAAVTGCYCNPNPPHNCMPTYSWHKPCDNPPPGYDCEKHFTSTPCQMGYTDQCPVATEIGLEKQLQTLRDLGEIHGDPHAILLKQLRTADQIRKDFERLGQPEKQ
jgi:hypothetical protein